MRYTKVLRCFLDMWNMEFPYTMETKHEEEITKYFIRRMSKMMYALTEEEFRYFVQLELSKEKDKKIVDKWEHYLYN